MATVGQKELYERAPIIEAELHSMLYILESFQEEYRDDKVGRNDRLRVLQEALRIKKEHISDLIKNYQIQ